MSTCTRFRRIQNKRRDYNRISNRAHVYRLSTKIMLNLRIHLFYKFHSSMENTKNIKLETVPQMVKQRCSVDEVNTS